MIYRKTDAGIEAIKNRASGLLPKQRSALIMFDGNRSADEVLKNTAGLGVTRDDLALLLSLKLITADKIEATAPTSIIAYYSGQPNSNNTVTRPASAASTVKMTSEELQLAIRRATRYLEDLLGPSCEPLNLRLEKCKTQDEFVIVVYDTRRVVSALRSEKKADEFVAVCIN